MRMAEKVGMDTAEAILRECEHEQRRIVRTTSGLMVQQHSVY